jgi:GT2 family glycosyltransferase
MPAVDPLRRFESPGRLAAVIATYNRADLLRATLDSLVEQRLDRSAFEVVVVDDGSADNTREVVNSFSDRLRICYSRQANAGLASARNHGLFLTRSPLVLFLDDDDIAGRDLLARHLETHTRHPGDNVAVLGFTALAPDLAHDPLMHFVTEVGCFLFSYPAIRHGQVLDFSYFWGGRTSCKRQFLIDHGIFNPVFRFGCEDIELAFRLSWHDLKVVYDAQAVSTMTRRISFDGFCNRLVRQGRSNYVFSTLHSADQVQAWTEVTGVDATWREIEPVYDAILRSARLLEKAVVLKAELGLPLNDGELELLHRGYWSAFRAAKIRGIIESKREKAADRTAGESGVRDEEHQRAVGESE